MKIVSIVGTRGVPAMYGGFETLAENLVRFQQMQNLNDLLVIVYCSAKAYQEKLVYYRTARLQYIPVEANGVSSILYDIISLYLSVRNGSNVILLLGVSGALALPFVRIFSRARIITNIDGIEWKRDKWKKLARLFLRFSEWMAIRFSHDVVADNVGIAHYVDDLYGKSSHVIAYGGDHAVGVLPEPYKSVALPDNYALALCRIEPENNVSMILDAFSRMPDTSLVFIGNWDGNPFGRSLRKQYSSYANLLLLNPIYDLGVLRTVRQNASMYIHGHSAGGTNPSLVEMMHFGLPILAFDCIFNQCTTGHKALFFINADDLCSKIESLTDVQGKKIGADMLYIAEKNYTWKEIGKAYFDLFDR